MANQLLAPKRLFHQSLRGLFGGKGETKLVKPPLPLFGVEGRYATALYSAGYKQKKLDSIEADLKKITELYEKDRPFRELLANPLVKGNEKKDILNKSLSTKLKFTDLTMNLIGVMAENGRLKYLPSVARSFNKVIAASRGEIECTVTTAKPLDEQMRRELEESLKGFAKGKKLLIQLKVDPDIIGGMLVDFNGEHFIDLSIRSKFNLYSNLIKQAV